MSTRDLKHPWKPSVWIIWIWSLYLGLVIARDQDLCEGATFYYFFVGDCAGWGKIMQNLVRSKTIGVTGNGGRGTAGAGPGRDLLYYRWCHAVQRGTTVTTAFTHKV